MQNLITLAELLTDELESRGVNYTVQTDPPRSALSLPTANRLK